MEFATQFIRDDQARIYYEKDANDNILFQRPYTDEENAHVNSERNRETLVQQAIAAMATNLEDIDRNTAALAVATPTNAQVVAQLKEVTRQSSFHAKQLNALMRLVLGKLDATT